MKTTGLPRTLRRGWWAALAASLALGLTACGGGNDTAYSPLELRTLSNRADLISGGDALVEVVVPFGGDPAAVKVDVNGRDVSSAFARRADGRVTGVVTGLAVGDNVLTASTTGAQHARLTVTNHSRGGAILAGQQVTPFACATPTAQAASGTQPATNASGLSTAATDAQCNIATEFKLYYKSTTAGCTLGLPDPSPSQPFTSTTSPANPSPAATNCFKPYDPAAPAPADLATTRLDTGATVPFIVRVERGTMNRGIYDIVTLFNPAQPWTATAPQSVWNGKILYTFGASTGQIRRQVRPATNWPSGEATIGRGYMWVVNSMTDSAVNSNRVMMAETVMMMKEHITDNYGPIRFTMGTGCSGGSINSNMNASIAPGQLDGITISCAYPDSETTAMEVSDCVGLVNAYQKPQWLALMAGKTPEQVSRTKGLINGHPDHTGCHGWYNAFGTNSQPGNYLPRTVTPTGSIVLGTTPTNNCQLPASQVYDPVTNPNGARCNAWDWAVAIFGRAPGTNRAMTTTDNEGVQYGLNALLRNQISAEEFVTINEIIGGVDKDSQFTATRSRGDLDAIAIAYRAGIVLSGKQYAKTAVIDLRGYDDSNLLVPPGGTASSIPIHYIWRSFSIRDRLDQEYGNHDNQVMWRFGRGLLPPAAISAEAFTVMDQWLTNLVTDTGLDDRAIKVRRARPATAFDFCIPTSDATQTTKITSFATCDQDPFLRPSASPRQVAGSPRTENILKCQLKPLLDADYGGRLSATQLTRLRAVFPGGVCDWSKPGMQQQEAQGTLTFRAGPGGQALPAAPTSTPI